MPIENLGTSATDWVEVVGLLCVFGLVYWLLVQFDLRKKTSLPLATIAHCSHGAVHAEISALKREKALQALAEKDNPPQDSVNENRVSISESLSEIQELPPDFNPEMAPKT